MSVSRTAHLLLGTALAAVLAACGGGGDGGGGPAKVPTSITITPGPNATVQSGATLQLTAVVLDQNGAVLPGRTVEWTSSSPSKATVSATGLVKGLVVGTTTINASIGTIFAIPPLTLSVTAGAPASLVAANALQPTMGAGSSDSVRTRVLDAVGNPVSGVTVTFSVTGGGSTLSSTTAVTDAAGVAAVRVTIGNQVGTVTTVTATVPGLNAVAFTTTSVAGQPTQLRITSPRVVIIDQGTTATLTVTLSDAFGNPLSTASGVDYISRGSAVTTNGRVVTGVSPGQAIVVAQLASNTAVRDSVLVVVAFPNGPVVLTDLMRFDLKADTTFTVPIIVDMRASGERLGSTRVQLTWDPTVLTYQSDSEGTTSVGAVVNNTTAVSGGLLTLAVANPNGFAGRVEIRRVTFRATATVGRTTSLALVVTELNGISPNFTNLKPRTVSVTHPLVTR